MAIENSVSNDFLLSAFVDSTCINVFDYRLSGVHTVGKIINGLWISRSTIIRIRMSRIIFWIHFGLNYMAYFTVFFLNFYLIDAIRTIRNRL